MMTAGRPAFPSTNAARWRASKRGRSASHHVLRSAGDQIAGTAGAPDDVSWPDHEHAVSRRIATPRRVGDGAGRVGADHVAGDGARAAGERHPEVEPRHRC